MKIPIIPIIFTYKNPLKYYLYLYGLLKNKSIQVSLFNDLSFTVRPSKSDLVILNEMFIEKQYQVVLPCNGELYQNVIDIGAHIGSFSVWISKYCKRVYAYEPEAENYSLLKKNYLNNKKKNINVYPFAIAENTGCKKLLLSPTNAAGNSLYSSKVATHNSQQIRCVKLSDEINRHNITSIDLIKIDCEGSEYEILSSLSDKNWRLIKRIVIEYHEWATLKHSHQEIIDHLTRHDFQIVYKHKLTPATGIIYAIRK